MAGIWDGVLVGPGGSEGTWERLSLLPKGLHPATRLGFFWPWWLLILVLPGSDPLCAKEDAAQTARDNLENYSCSYAAWLVSSPQRWPRAGVMSLRDRWLPKAPAWVPDLKYRVGREQVGWGRRGAGRAAPCGPCGTVGGRGSPLGARGNAWPSAKGAGTQPALGTAGNQSCLPSLLFQQVGADRFTRPGRCLSVPSRHFVPAPPLPRPR